MSDRPPKPPKKVFDIVRPGKTMASPSSRPIIGQSKPVADSQVAPKPAPTGAASPHIRSTNHTAKRAVMPGRSTLVSAPDDEQTPSAPTVPQAVMRRKKVITPVSLNDSETVPAAPAAKVDPLLEEPTAGDAQPRGFDDIDTSDVGASAAADPALLAHKESAVQEAKPQLINSQPTKVNIVSQDEEQDNPLLAVGESERASDDAELDDYLDKIRAIDEPDYSAPIAAKHQTSREDIMSGAGMDMPDHDAEDERRTVVSHHKKHRLHWWQWMLVAFFILLLAVVALNFLIDAEALQTELNIPHTNLL